MEMIELGKLFNKVLPIEFVMRLPRPYVYRLRDHRIKQLMEERKAIEKSTKGSSGFGYNTMEDIIDELT